MEHNIRTIYGRNGNIIVATILDGDDVITRIGKKNKKELVKKVADAIKEYVESFDSGFDLPGASSNVICERCSGETRRYYRVHGKNLCEKCARIEDSKTETEEEEGEFDQIINLIEG